ncbi:MAG: S24 family peptidase, partial [Bacteroidota bacterium]
GLQALFQRDSKPESYIRIPGLPRCDGAVFVIGDHMYPFLKSGDIVMYKEIHNIPESLIWGEMYLTSIDLDGEEYISVKRIQKSDRGQDYVKLVSQNQHHEAKDIAIERIVALALIKANIHINTMQ